MYLCLWVSPSGQGRVKAVTLWAPSQLVHTRPRGSFCCILLRAQPQENTEEEQCFMVRKDLFRFRVEFPDLALIEGQNVTSPPPPFHFERGWIVVSFSTQVLALNWAGRCKEKWGKEKAEKRIPPSSSRWKALLSECRDTGIWGASHLPHHPQQLSKAKRAQNIKGTTEMNMKTRIGPGTYHKSCKLRGLWGPGRHVRNGSAGVCESVGSGQVCGKPKDTFVGSVSAD